METPFTLTVHGATLGGILLILAILFKQHKIWVRIKDRLNLLYADYCKAHGIPYQAIENGKD